MKNQLRELLKVPKEQRIAQWIYNCCKTHENKAMRGIDIYSLEDDEFIKLMENK